MKPFRILLLITTLALTLLITLAVTTATADTKKIDNPPVDPRILVKSVDASAGTIVIIYMRDKKVQTYKIDDATVVKVNNSPGKISDIKGGMEVSDSSERDSETLDTISLTGSGAPIDSGSPKKKKK